MTTTTQHNPVRTPTLTTSIIMPSGRDDSGVSGDNALETVVGLLDDEHVRSILTATSEEALSAKELSERCDISQATVYRRVDQLTNVELVTERTRPRADGHHDTVYVARLDELTIRLQDGQLEFELDKRGEDIADRLTRLWEEF